MNTVELLGADVILNFKSVHCLISNCLATCEIDIIDKPQLGHCITTMNQ